MENQNYSELLKDPRWQRKRLEIMQRDEFTCVMCDDKEHTLNVHHDEYIRGNMPWEYENSKLRTLCEDCHYLVTNSEHGIEPLHKVLYKYKNENDSTIYILAWPDEIDIFEKTKEGKVNHIIYLPDHKIQTILDYLTTWQEKLGKENK